MQNPLLLDLSRTEFIQTCIDHAQAYILNSAMQAQDAGPLCRAAKPSQFSTARPNPTIYITARNIPIPVMQGHFVDKHGVKRFTGYKKELRASGWGSWLVVSTSACAASATDATTSHITRPKPAL